MSHGARCGLSAMEVYIIPAPVARAGHQQLFHPLQVLPYDTQLALQGRMSMTKSMIVLHVCNDRHTFRHRMSPYLFRHAIDLSICDRSRTLGLSRARRVSHLGVAATLWPDSSQRKAPATSISRHCCA